jgi:CheY-like chemotaxis protein
MHADDRSSVVQHRAAPVIDSPSTSGELLVVEAHADTAESLQLLLETLGYVVHVALDAATALVLADRYTIDLAFVAIGLPDVDGYTLARRLRALGRPRVLVALTGYGHDADRQRATDAGFDDHLLKPATVEQLETVLARFVKSQPR